MPPNLFFVDGFASPEGPGPGPYGPIWAHMGSSGPIWGPYGPKRALYEPTICGPTRARSGLGPIWALMGPYVSILDSTWIHMAGPWRA